MHVMKEDARYHLSRVCTRGDSVLLLRALFEGWPTTKRKEQQCEDTSVPRLHKERLGRCRQVTYGSESENVDHRET